MSITKEDIKHLGNLSRIKLNENEVNQFQNEVNDILGYVSAVDSIVSDTDLTKKLGPVSNVFREDVVINTHDSNADDLVEAFPEREGRFLKVKKILHNDG